MAALAKLAFSVLCEAQAKAAKHAKEQFERQMKERQEIIKQRFDAMQLLLQNEIINKRDEYALDMDLRYGIDPIHIKESKEFQKIHKIFGKLQLDYKTIYNAETREVQVYLVPKDEKYKDVVKFWYLRTLKETDPCKIEERVSTYKTLVCSV